MKYTQYALFKVQEEADAALRDIESAGLPPSEVRIVVHRDGMKETDLVHSETDARGGLVSGVIAGSLGGAVMGLLLAGPFHLLPVGLVMGALVCGLAGLIIGGLGASLYGAGLTNPTVRRLGARMKEGQVLLTAETNNLNAREAVEQIIRRHGAVPA